MNRFLERLGFSASDRVVILHADDLGMCHAANQAFADIVARGTARSGSIMVPCPWFLEIAALARDHGAQVDLGVHLTLTSEWEHYRWGPLTTRSAASGLLDEQGYFWRDVESLHAHMDPTAAAAELHAQVERALAAGADVTHVDTHMGAVLHLALVPVYIGLAQTYRIPAMLPRLSQQQIIEYGVPQAIAAQLAGVIDELEASGTLPLIDHVTDVPAAAPGERMAEYAAAFDRLPAGLTHLIYHPSRPGAEIEAVTTGWAARTGDHAVFASEALAGTLAAAGVQVLTYRTLRDLLRGEMA